MCSLPTARCDVRLAGRVQGVGFRWWARQLALELGLTGTVRNLADGTVEIHATGSLPAVDSFRQRLHQGPPAGRVVSLTDIDPSSDAPDDFMILL